MAKVWTHPYLDALPKIPAAVRTRWTVDATYARLIATKYGLTPEQYLAILAYQDGRCYLCKRLPRSRRLNVDHDHTSKKVRGLTCFDCNKILAWWKDDSECARRFISYLNEHPAELAGVFVTVPAGADEATRLEKRGEPWKSVTQIRGRNVA